MIGLLTPDDVRTIDRSCEIDLSIPPIVLMENAARSAADILSSLLPAVPPSTILVACGAGNNGGDGFALARMLSFDNTVQVVWMGEENKMSDATRANLHAAQRLVSVVHIGEAGALDLIGKKKWDVVIDALIGVGGGADLRGPVIDLLDRLHRADALKVAIDVPSGLDALTGDAHASCFRAHHTITMAGPKPGLYRNDGPMVRGTIHVASIGAPSELLRKNASSWMLTRDDVRTMLPTRKRNTSKHDYGRVVVIAGSRPMRGAGALASHAAISAGAGVVDLVTPVLHPLTAREVMTLVVPATPAGTMAKEARAMIQDKLARATVVAIGPGVGTDPETRELLTLLIEELDPSIPVVIDADGLLIVPYLNRALHNVILTPHLGEFARLLGKSKESIARRTVEYSKGFAKEHGCILHVKDVPSITTNGTQCYYTVNGNPGMATAGSGDVLTGVIAALCAQGVKPFKAAALGAYVHASAGDHYATVASMETLTASDLIASLRYVFPA